MSRQTLSISLPAIATLALSACAASGPSQPRTCGSDNPCAESETCSATGCVPACSYQFSATKPGGAETTFRSWDADNGSCLRMVRFGNGAWSGSQVSGANTLPSSPGTTGGSALLSVTWGESPPQANTTYVLSSASSPLMVQLSLDKISTEVDGLYDTVSSRGANVTLKVGAFKLEDGGPFELQIESGSVIAGANDTRLDLSGTFTGVFARP
jgi:hypothetical protein